MKLFTLLLCMLSFSLNNNCKDPAAGNGEAAENSTVQTKDKSPVKDTTVSRTHFGVLVAKSEGRIIPPERQVQVAKALGVNYIRSHVEIQGWNGNIEAYNIYAAAGMKILLNINYGIPRNLAGEHDPVPFPTDMDTYSKTVNAILDKYKPEVVVIENEEDNPNYHSGSAEDYINELITAIQIVHSKGLKVTNGGITVREVCLIVYDDMVQHGQKQKAIDFAKRALPENFLQRMNSNMNNPQVARQLEFGRKIIAAYKTLDLDYVNFHWYEPVQARGQAAKANVDFDPEIFEFVATYLKNLTGKPLLTNEFGVFNTSPALVRSLLQTVSEAGLSYAIFYSADGGTGKAVGLQNAGGDLRDNGLAFRDFIKQYSANN